MEVTHMSRRSGVPLAHIVIALFIAAAAAGSLRAWLSKKATQSASAELAFNPNLAQHFDPGLASAQKPAVALADSILSDQAIAALAGQSHPLSATAASQVGEFRSNLELTQPSSTVLRVQFLDSDSGRSAANANAVAKVLAAWTPSLAGSPAPAQEAAASAASSPTTATTAQGWRPEDRPVSAPSLPDHSSPRHSLSDSLGDISSQLAATDRELDRLAGEPDSGHSPYRKTASAYRQFRQQQRLKAQVNAAEKKLDDLQAQYGKADSALGVGARLTTIRQALDSILRTGEPSQHSADGQGFKAAGTSAGQLRRERSQLSQAISVINDQRQAIEQADSAQSPSVGTSPPSPSASASPASAQASSSLQQTSLPTDSGTSPTQQPSEHPLSMVRLASPTPPAPLWPAILAGLVCGLFYLGSAAWVYRRTEDDREDEDYAEAEEIASPQRFVTPNLQFHANSEEDSAREPSATRTEPAKDESTSRQPEWFEYRFARDKSKESQRAAFLWNDVDEASGSTREEPHAETGQSASPEGRDEKVDHFTDELKKGLAETSIGKMFEAADQDALHVTSSENSPSAPPA
jgi:hypothetical protein